MIDAHGDRIKTQLRIDCGKCFGLCCVALYFSATEGFPTDKYAGTPCINLQSDFTCSIHKSLKEKGLKGCIAYDCFGAGQKVSQVTYCGHDWLQAPQSAKEMFEVFLVVKQLHEMLWYLNQALYLQTDHYIQREIGLLIEKIEYLTILDAASLIALDIAAHRVQVKVLLQNISELVRAANHGENSIRVRNRNSNSRPLDYFGADLRKTNLRGADLRGACLIAANLRGADLSGADLIGADMRDAELSGADLTNSIFLTQAQINTAKGDFHTRLPSMLVRPVYWPK